jgi:hypothetical protein
MLPADRKDFLKILNGLAAIKPGAKLIPEALEMWWAAMEAWSLDEFKQAASHLARSIEFMPSPYHFEQLRKAGRSTPGEAWASVLRYVRNDWSPLGPIVNGGTPEPQDELVKRTVAAVGGYRAIAQSNTESTHFLERRFCEHYESIQDAHEVREALPQLTAPGKRLNGSRSARELIPTSLNIGDVDGDT